MTQILPVYSPQLVLHSSEHSMRSLESAAHSTPVRGPTGLDGKSKSTSRMVVTGKANDFGKKVVKGELSQFLLDRIDDYTATDATHVVLTIAEYDDEYDDEENVSLLLTALEDAGYAMEDWSI